MQRFENHTRFARPLFLLQLWKLDFSDRKIRLDPFNSTCCWPSLNYEWAPCWLTSLPTSIWGYCHEPSSLPELRLIIDYMLKTSWLFNEETSSARTTSNVDFLNWISIWEKTILRFGIKHTTRVCRFRPHLVVYSSPFVFHWKLHHNIKL